MATKKAADRHSSKALSGVISCSSRGSGFVSTPIGDIFIPAEAMRGAWHKDEVTVELREKRRGPGKSLSGVITAVKRRAYHKIVGIVEAEQHFALVRPANKRLSNLVQVPLNALAGATGGDVVVVEITRYASARERAQGKVTKVLGNVAEPGVDIDTIVYSHELPIEFSSAALLEAASLAAEKVRVAVGSQDLRHLYTVTIDGLDAKDFDDAVSLRATEDGHFDLWVHIANVSHYVKVGSAIDTDALERGTSVYLPDRVIPMLPEELSNDLCSLKPNVDRLAMTVLMRVDAGGDVVEHEIFESVIRSDARLTYEEVDARLADHDFSSETLAKLLLALELLSQVLSKKRISRGSLEFETVEPKIILSEDKWPIEVLIRERTPATQIIEEAMILTNETVARDMMHAGVPMIYRVHDKPDPEAVAAMSILIRQLGYPIRTLEDAHPRTFQALIEWAHKRPEKLLINSLLLRAMSKAKYAANWQEHFGLASEHYTHFTSPIRRYPDLIVHRLVKARAAATIGSSETAPWVERLPEMAEHCSEREREAQGAERESVDAKMAQFMLGRIGEEFDAVISGVTSFGLFVELDNSAEGLVLAAKMKDDYYRFEAERYLMRGERTGKVYRLGQAVRVRLVDVSVAKRELDFEILEDVK